MKKLHLILMSLLSLSFVAMHAMDRNDIVEVGAWVNFNGGCGSFIQEFNLSEGKDSPVYKKAETILDAFTDTTNPKNKFMRPLDNGDESIQSYNVSASATSEDNFMGVLNLVPRPNKSITAVRGLGNNVARDLERELKIKKIFVSIISSDDSAA